MQDLMSCCHAKSLWHANEKNRLKDVNDELNKFIIDLNSSIQTGIRLHQSKVFYKSNIKYLKKDFILQIVREKQLKIEVLGEGFMIWGWDDEFPEFTPA